MTGTRTRARAAAIAYLLKHPEDAAWLDSWNLLPSMPRILVERRFRGFLRRHGLALDTNPALDAAWNNMLAELSNPDVSAYAPDPDRLQFFQEDEEKADGVEWCEFIGLDECRQKVEALLGRSVNWPKKAERVPYKR